MTETEKFNRLANPTCLADWHLSVNLDKLLEENQMLGNKIIQECNHSQIKGEPK